MASAELTAELERLSEPSIAGPDKCNAYIAMLTSISSSTSSTATSAANLNAILDSIMGQNGLGSVGIRPLLSKYIETVETLSSTTEKLEAIQHALSLLQSRGGQFPEEEANIRFLAADLYEGEDEHTAAARMLSGINLDAAGLSVEDEKIGVWVRIVRHYLEDNDTTSAEIYLNKAKNLILDCKDQVLKLMFQLSQARILDARRKFLAASQSYHALSFSPLVVEPERLQALSAAIICGVLAPAGPQRSRALANLYRDERSATLASFPLLSHMYLGRLVSPMEVSDFSKSLSAHHLATLSDGSTVLAKAVIEHNLLSSSRLYDDIGFEALGRLLDLSADGAEGYAARMIEQGRLSGRIDQIEGIIFFEHREGTGEVTKAGQADRVVGTWLRRWDANVRSLTEEVERVIGVVASRYPEFVATEVTH